MSTRNDPRHTVEGHPHYPHRFNFDRLCAYCDRPIPTHATYPSMTWVLHRLGWSVESDGTLVCNPCAATSNRDVLI